MTPIRVVCKNTLNMAWDGAVDADVNVNVGGLLTFWNAGSHTGYWSDGGVAKRIAEVLARQYMEGKR